MIGQECSVDKKKAEFLSGNFLKNLLFEKQEKYGRHLKFAGCENVKCFRTLYMLEKFYC